MSSRRTTTRPKKLQSRQHIQIVREDQVEQVTDFDSGRAPIETGVEKAEEAVSSPFTLFAPPLLSLTQNLLRVQSANFLALTFAINSIIKLHVFINADFA